jgi:hypothetical protein
MFLVGHLPRIADTAAATLTETTVAYRHSALSVRHGAHHRGTAQAGEHAPDPDGLLGPDGNPVTIEDLLTRPGMLLLVRSTDEVDDLRATLGDLGTVVRVVRDGASADGVTNPGDVLGRAYGWGADGDGMVLIRPDGYLGLPRRAARARQTPSKPGAANRCCPAGVLGAGRSRRWCVAAHRRRRPRCHLV